MVLKYNEKPPAQSFIFGPKIVKLKLVKHEVFSLELDTIDTLLFQNEEVFYSLLEFNGPQIVNFWPDKCKKDWLKLPYNNWF